MNVSVRMKVVAASWDTQLRLPYNPHSPPKPKKIPSPSSLNLSPNATSQSPLTVTLSVSELLKRSKASSKEGEILKADDSYLGYDLWMPNPPKVQKPRSVYNAATLAYIGDCIYELYARRHFLFPPLTIEEHNDRVMAVVRCEAQDAFLQKVLNDKYLTEEERDVLRWGKNVGSSKTRTKRRAGVAVYNRASSLETLIGYLYHTNVKRLDDIMQRMGFSTGDSAQAILEEAHSTQT